MKTIIAIVAVLIATQAHAELFKCPGKDGRVNYSDTPCQGERGAKLNIKSDVPTLSDQLRAQTELAVIRRQVFIGMSRADVIRSWGMPSKINTTMNSDVLSEQFVYRRDGINSRYVYIRNGVVTTIQD